ncbi:MAG: ABC transporter ATP-binding protein [archaeon]|nr:ABC transporter ATP-binding protein [archaeon]
MVRLEVKDLCFGYDGGKQILHDISFAIDEPSFVCIVGPNGVGKSTLIRCMNGLIQPSSGGVFVDGRNVRDIPLKELARMVSYVPVMTSDFNVLTVLDTVLIGRYAHQDWKTTKEDLEISHLALESMEIDHLSMRNFNELSAGQHQKVSLARGLVQEAGVVLLDEPTSNLDIRHQMYVSAFLKELVRETGVTVVMISHDLNLSAKYADRMIVMEPPGRIYGYGSPKEVMTSEMLERVYHVKADISDDHGVPHVVPQAVIFDGDFE